jgi:hypothetical protein
MSMQCQNKASAAHISSVEQLAQLKAVTELTMLVPWFIVSPQSWKKFMGVTFRQKLIIRQSEGIMENGTTETKKDHGIAESLLLAEWLRRQA